jgi:hypothetical protein
MAKKPSKNTPVAGTPVVPMPADDIEIHIDSEPEAAEPEAEPAVIIPPKAATPAPAAPKAAPAAPAIADERDPACATRRQHRSNCSCTGSLRAPIR